MSIDSNDRYQRLRESGPRGLRNGIPGGSADDDMERDAEIINMLNASNDVSTSPHAMNVAGMGSKIPKKSEISDSLAELANIDLDEPDEINEESAEESKSEDKEKEDNTENESNRLETVNPKTLVIIVWVLVVVLILAVVLFNVSKNKKDKKTEIKSVINTVSIPTINTGGDMWTDYMTVTKTVEINSSNIQCLLIGNAENYGKSVCLPVSVKEYNSVTEGTRIAIHFNELKLNGKDYINIISWEGVPPE